MVTEEVHQYYLNLERSSRPRTYYLHVGADARRWYLEAVQDGGETVPIRQLVVEADGTKHAYSAGHLDDDWGGLRDQPIGDAERLTEIGGADFAEQWGPE